MCDPLTIAGIALSAGSMVANKVAANKVQDARNAAMAAERTRQNALDSQSQALNLQSQDRYQEFGDKQGDRASELGDYFTDQKIEQGNANQTAVAQQIMPQSSSNIVVSEEGKQRGEAREFADQQGRALGDLRSFGDLIGSIGRKQARDAGEIGQINSFKRGSADVLPFELEAANGAGNGIKTFADILGLAGSVTTGAGLGGGSPLSKFPPAPGAAGGFDWRGLIRGGPGGAPSAQGGNLYSLYR